MIMNIKKTIIVLNCFQGNRVCRLKRYSNMHSGLFLAFLEKGPYFEIRKLYQRFCHIGKYINLLYCYLAFNNKVKHKIPITIHFIS